MLPQRSNWMGIMARKTLASRKQPERKNQERRLREFIFEQMSSAEAGGAKDYGRDLIVNMDLVYHWIIGSRIRPHVVVDNHKS